MVWLGLACSSLLLCTRSRCSISWYGKRFSPLSQLDQQPNVPSVADSFQESAIVTSHDKVVCSIVGSANENMSLGVTPWMTFKGHHHHYGYGTAIGGGNK
jgi:hypothetical protein